MYKYTKTLEQILNISFSQLSVLDDKCIFFSGSLVNKPAVSAQNNYGSKAEMALTFPPPLLLTGLPLIQQI